MNTNRNFPWWGVLLGIGCVGFLCIGIVGVGGFTYFYMQKPSAQLSPEIVSTVPLPATEGPVPSEIPLIPEPTLSVNPEPTSSGSALTGNQELSEYRLYDDFSSEALSWPVANDGKIILKYEDGQYSFQVTEPDYYDWAYAPVDFTPTDIWFDVMGTAGPQTGTFGVFCRFQDADNYYYVEFDLGERSYVIGQYVGGRDIVLTPQNAQGQYWQEANALKSSPSDTNRIGISCYKEFITLFVNDEWVTETNIQTPFDNVGDIALFVYAFSSAGNEGYKVYFDNVEVYKPVQ